MSADARLSRQVSAWQTEAARLHIRLPIVWQGEQTVLLAATEQLLTETRYDKLYWLGDDAPPDAVTLNGKQHYQLLGSECDVLVINAFSGFAADLVAASAGCVKAGGLWLLLCPPFKQWRQLPNPAHKNLLPYPLHANIHHGQFLPFWLAQLQQQNIVLLNQSEIEQTLIWPEPAAPYQAVLPYMSDEQQTAVAAILHVVSGHRRRPLVLSADRGRGKSAALGIAAAQLAATGKHILITAPSPQAAEVAISHFCQLAPLTQQTQLQFVPFDQLLRSNNSADLLLIDEAAAIPTPQLQQLLKHFSRIVFATTEHGYEGTGRGFQLRFQQHLAQQCPGWTKLHLQQPIRYQSADPLEQLLFQTFLLKQYDSQPVYDPQMPVNFIQYTAEHWLQAPEKLQQVFSLLSLAHYQTQVKDLAALLDNPQLQVVTLEQADKVLACTLLSSEGEIPAELAEQIYHGERRLQGHLLAQSLAFHLAQPKLASLVLWRVMRIAVHPALQRLQLGSKLLSHISQLAQQAGISYLGTSFGITAELLQFWQQADYLPVRLGSSSDKSSGEYSIVLLNAVQGSAGIVRQLQLNFGRQLYLNLPEQHPLLATELAVALAQPPQHALTDAELEQLALFVHGRRPYELVSPLLLRWFNCHYHHLPTDAARLFCARLWQKRSWSELTLQFQQSGKKQLLGLMQQQLVVRLQQTKPNQSPANEISDL